MPFNDHAQLLPRVQISPAAPFPILLTAMDETSSFSLEFLAEHCVDPVYSYLPTCYSPSSLRTPRLAALEFAVISMALNVAPGGGPSVELSTIKTLGLQSRNSLRDAEVHGLEGQLR